jgi:hypothetical protein
MYGLKYTLLSRMAPDEDFKVVSSNESFERATSFRDARHMLTQAGQSLYKTELKSHGIGNVYYHVDPLALTNIKRRELMIETGGDLTMLHRIEIIKCEPDVDVPMRDDVHYDMG